MQKEVSYYYIKDLAGAWLLYETLQEIRTIKNAYTMH